MVVSDVADIVIDIVVYYGYVENPPRFGMFLLVTTLPFRLLFLTFAPVNIWYFVTVIPIRVWFSFRGSKIIRRRTDIRNSLKSMLKYKWLG